MGIEIIAKKGLLRIHVGCLPKHVYIHVKELARQSLLKGQPWLFVSFSFHFIYLFHSKITRINIK